MASARLYPPQQPEKAQPNPLPQLIQTPSGLALLELQGVINLPLDATGQVLKETIQVGRIDFPDHVPGSEGSAWMKRVHMHIGQHQRLTGEVKKLAKAVAVIRRREEKQPLQGSASAHPEQGDDLEVVDLVKYKIIFSARPEPVGTQNAA